MQLPAANRHGCVSYEAPHDALVLVDRGKCSVVAQALQAKAARAHGLIVRGTKEDVYEDIRREHAPVSKPVFKYDCCRGEAFVANLARWPHPCALCRHWCRDHGPVVTTPVADTWIPSLAGRDRSLPLVGDTVRCADVLGLLPLSALALVWYVHRRTYWVYQDLMGICLCVYFLSTVSFPNLLVAAMLLLLACYYDPLVLGSSVMEDVATGGPAAHTIRDYPGAHGAGVREWLIHGERGCRCLLYGQPALLYLVPTTLGALLVLSKCRGDLDAMWTGAGVITEEKHSDAS
ncbi:hypothetical protein PsorP6_001917 [Peronosclerospora sorghi]|uniref:Uncharacterized protein n=1 Tax=Peronosclerospora sorghi TaxID=230839 RepID=A0ACC0WPJ1_9STRA|nr:hypothetical protein PsorP6_001917 [Peronosclerospora sorghi]